MSKRKVIIVLGPTGSGKSEIAHKIAKDFNGFLIVADSRQIYTEMDIGTNKDPVELKDGKYYWKGIEECLVNIVAPNEEFTLDDWLKACKQCINDHPTQLPVIVGGTGLYISALVNNYQLGKGFDPKLRQKAEELLKAKGIEYLLSEIKKIDPEIEHKIESTNSRRVLRAYQICSSTGKPLTFEKGESEYEFVQFGMKTDREKLYEKLDKRAKAQFDEGLVEEVKNLLNKGVHPESPALSGIGYRNVVKYLKDEITKEEAVELNQRDNRRYAKRQMTWFKRDKEINWIEGYKEVKNILNNKYNMGFEDQFVQPQTPESPVVEQLLTPENVELKYSEPIAVLGENYERAVEEDMTRKGMYEGLKVHNKIVRDYATEIISKIGLEGKDKSIAMLGTIFHDSAKLDSGLVEHHQAGAETAAVLVDKLIGKTIDGVTISNDMVEPIAKAVLRHQNHPFLVNVFHGGKRFDEPQTKADQTVYLADMMANIGFKNIVFRLFPGQFPYSDISKSMNDKSDGHLVEALDNVFNDPTGVAHLVNNVFYEDEAATTRRESMAGTEEIEKYMQETVDQATKIYIKLKIELPKLEEELTHKDKRSGAESYGHRIWTISAEDKDGEGVAAGVNLVKRKINALIDEIGIAEGIDQKMVDRFKM